MKDKINVSQFSLLLLIVITGGKFLSLPALLAKDVGHDSWLVLLVCFAADLVCLCFVLWAVRKNALGLGLEQILGKTLGPFSKVIFVVFFVLFVCRIILLLDSCYNAFAVTFDVNTNWVLFVLPILAVGAFATSRGFVCVARVGQLLFAVILLAIVALLIYPTTRAEWGSLLPVGEAGAGKIFRTAIGRSFWFSDYIFVYFVLEDLRPQKRLFAPVLTGFAVGVLLTVLLNAVFVALFGELAPQNNLAMSKIGLFSVAQSGSGRWDWITLSVWMISVIIKVVIFVFCAYKCVEKALGLHFEKLNFWVIFAMGILLLLPLFLPVEKIAETFVLWCLVPFCLVQYLLPVLLPFLTQIANKKAVPSDAKIQGEKDE